MLAHGFFNIPICKRCQFGLVNRPLISRPDLIERNCRNPCFIYRDRLAAGDDNIVLVPGAGVLGADLLADGIHPGDAGHARLAEVFGSAVAGAVGRAGRGD